jgi:hypothetical protein
MPRFKARVAAIAGMGAAIIVAALTVSMPAVPAATGTTSPAPPPAAIKINLQSAFASALPHTTMGRRAGIVPPVGTRGPRLAASLASGCTEPDCNLSYGGGPVQHSPHVYLLLWGPNWTNSNPAYADLYNLYRGLGVTAQDSWSTVSSQYGDGTGHPTFSGSVFVKTYQDTHAPPNPVTPTDVADEADTLASQIGVSADNNAQIVVASQSGTCFSDGFEGNCGSAQNSSTDYCAWHSSSNEPFTNLPYLLDAGTECGENFVNAGSAGTYDGFNIIGGHEYAETVTDPDPFTGWSDSGDSISDGGAPGEIGDKCAWGGSGFGLSDPIGDVTLSTGTFAMQSLWSNAAGRCVMTSLTTGLISTIYAPIAVDDTNGSLANGNPIQVWSDTTGSRANQRWTLVSKGSYDVVELARSPGHCLDVRNGGTTNGTKLQLWSCNGGVDQEWKPLVTGQLEAVYATGKSGRTMVLDDPSFGGNGTKLHIWQLNGLAQQFWSMPS